MLIILFSSCFFCSYIFDVCYTYAAWLVTAVGVERFIVVWYPLKAKTICTRRSSVITVCVMPPIILVMYAFNIWGWELDDGGELSVIIVNTLSPLLIYGDFNDKFYSFFSLTNISSTFHQECLVILKHPLQNY